MLNYMQRKLQYHFASCLLTAFDPEQFSAMPIEGTNDTVFTPVDEGEYAAIVKDKTFRTTDKGQVILDVVWELDDQGQKEKTGRDQLTVRQSIFLDRTESGGLDMGKGKNISLGRLREATGLNVPGQAFRFDDLVGKPAMVKVTQRPDKDDPDVVYNDVKKVSPLQ